MWRPLGERDRHEWHLLLLGTAIGVLAQGISLFTLAYAPDDVVFINFDFNFEILRDHAFREGRFLYPFFVDVMWRLGLNIHRTFTLSGLLLILSFSLVGVMICKIWGITRHLVLSGLVVAIVASHPYKTDLFTWKIALFTGGPPFVLAVGSILLARRGWWGTALGAAMLVLSLSVHQLGLTYAAVATIIWAFLVIARSLTTGRIDECEMYAVGRAIVAMSFGVLVYWVAAAAVINWADLTSELHRERLILISDPWLVLRRMAELQRMMIWDDPLTSPLQRGLLAMCAILGVGGLSYKIFRRRSIWVAMAAFGLFCAVLALAVAASVAFLVVPTAWQPSFRSMGALSVVISGIIVTAHFYLSGRLRKVIVVVAGLLCIGFIGKSNEIFVDQLRANQRDRSLITRLAADLERIEEFRTVRRIVILGATSLALTNLRTALDLSRTRAGYGTTVSVFASYFESSYRVMLFNEVTGYFYGSQLTAEERSVADQYCHSQLPWPARKGIAIHTDFAIVCLSQPLTVGLPDLWSTL